MQSQFAARSAEIENDDTAPVVRIQFRPTPHWKRAVDLILCVLCLPILGLVTLVISVVVKIVSPGPVFFTQERIGYLGRSFMIFKFRTMSVGADSASHRALVHETTTSRAPMEKMDTRGDARLIPGGRFIRACGLDELPQIINVLRGEMLPVILQTLLQYCE